MFFTAKWIVLAMEGRRSKRYLSDPLGTLLAKLSRVAEVLHQVRQQTQHIERETCTTEIKTLRRRLVGGRSHSLPAAAAKLIT